MKRKRKKNFEIFSYDQDRSMQGIYKNPFRKRKGTKDRHFPSSLHNRMRGKGH